MMMGRSEQLMRWKWFWPLFCLVMGGVILAASWLGGWRALMRTAC